MAILERLTRAGEMLDCSEAEMWRLEAVRVVGGCCAISLSTRVILTVEVFHLRQLRQNTWLIALSDLVDSFLKLRVGTFCPLL